MNLVIALSIAGSHVRRFNTQCLNTRIERSDEFREENCQNKGTSWKIPTTLILATQAGLILVSAFNENLN